MAAIFRPPLIQRIIGPVRLNEGNVASPNPLLNALQGKDQFFGPAGDGPTYDWPNPQLPRYAIDLRTWTFSTDVELLNLTIVPKKQHDWPVPPGPRWPIDVRTWTNCVSMTLLKQDKFFGAPGQPPTYDYPNPRGPVFSNELRSWVQFNLDTESNQVKPFNQYDWPVPKGYLFPLENRNFTSDVEIQLIGKDQLFGAAGETQTYDWPNPQLPRYAIDLRGWINSLSLSIYFANIQLPFFQNDWPVPKGPIFGADLRTFVNPIEPELIGKDTVYGAQGEVPSYDWPNPGVPRYEIGLKSWLWPLQLGLRGKDTFFGPAGLGPTYDYPLPLPKVHANLLKDWSVTAPLALLTATPSSPVGGDRSFIGEIQQVGVGTSMDTSMGT